MAADAYFNVIDTPVGPLFIGGSGRGLHHLDFLPSGPAETEIGRAHV